MSKNYRERYKQYYKIDFDDSYDIHHIDFNRENNNIRNLLLLPKKLHIEYHSILEKVDPFWEKGSISINPQLETETNIQLLNAKELIEIIEKCMEWVNYKQILDIERLEERNI